MRKLLKYEFLNSYKFMIAISIFAISGYAIDGYLKIYKNTPNGINTFTTLAAFAGIIAYCISSINDFINAKDAIILYYVPMEKRKIFAAKIIMIFVYVTMLVFIICIFNLISNYMPFIGISDLRGNIIFSFKQKVAINLFYMIWSISLILVLILFGILLIIVTKVICKANKFLLFADLALLYVLSFAYFKTINLFMAKTNLNFTIDISNLYHNYHNISQTVFFGNQSIAIYRQDYQSIAFGLSAPIYNIIWIILLYIGSLILFSKKVEV